MDATPAAAAPADDDLLIGTTITAPLADWLAAGYFMSEIDILTDADLDAAIARARETEEPRSLTVDRRTEYAKIIEVLGISEEAGR